MKKTLTMVANRNEADTYLMELYNNLSEYFVIYWGNDFFWEENFETHYYLIHWPEHIGCKPNEECLSKLEERINSLKSRGAIFAAIFHNEYPHYDNSEFNKKLYKIVYGGADKIIHLGEYSINLIKEIIPETQAKEHQVIPHPLFESIENTTSSKESREKLGFAENDFIVTIFGALRNKVEVKLAYKIFSKLKIKNKKLLIAGGKIDHYSSFPEKIYNKIYRYYHCGNNLLHINKRIEDNEIQIYFNAADAILIPRPNTLNSGVALMALTFNKPFVSPSVGNLTELALATGNKTFNKENIASAVNIISNIKNTTTKVPENYKGKNVANELYKFITKEQ